MIRRGTQNRLDAQRSAEVDLEASEALPLDAPGQATLLARAQVYALLDVAAALSDVGSLIESAGGTIQMGLDGVAEAGKGG